MHKQWLMYLSNMRDVALFICLRDTTGTESYDSITTQYYRGGAVSV